MTGGPGELVSLDLGRVGELTTYDVVHLDAFGLSQVEHAETIIGGGAVPAEDDQGVDSRFGDVDGWAVVMGVDLPELPRARRLKAGTEQRLRLAETIEDQPLAGLEFEGEPVLLSGESDGAFDG